MSMMMDSEGDFHKIDLLVDRNPFFRKMFNKENTTVFDKERQYSSLIEREIYKILKAHPQPNVVTVYNITDDYVDIELVDTCIKNVKKAIESADNAKTQLQRCNIMYIDWKLDNMGVAKDGTYKIFDFDVSGIVKKRTPSEWKMKPLEYYTYKKIVANDKDLTPIEIDNKAFELFSK